MLLIVILKIIPFALRAISTDWRYVYQACSVLKESSSFDWNVYVCDVVKAKFNKFLKLFLPQKISNTLNDEKKYRFGKQLSSFNSDEAVLTEEIIVETDGLFIELLTYFDSITSSNKSNVDDFLQLLEGMFHVARYFLNEALLTLRGLVSVPSISKRHIRFILS